jgi:cytochrome P450
MSRLANAVAESLRLEFAAAIVDRYATVDIELAGAAIRCGELVRVSIAIGAHQRSRRPTDPMINRDAGRSQRGFGRHSASSAGKDAGMSRRTATTSASRPTPGDEVSAAIRRPRVETA